MKFQSEFDGSKKMKIILKLIFFCIQVEKLFTYFTPYYEKKIRSNFVGLAVVRKNDYEKTRLPH